MSATWPECWKCGSSTCSGGCKEFATETAELTRWHVEADESSAEVWGANDGEWIADCGSGQSAVACAELIARAPIMRNLLERVLRGRIAHRWRCNSDEPDLFAEIKEVLAMPEKEDEQ